jgi:hypothetical protein
MSLAQSNKRSRFNTGVIDVKKLLLLAVAVVEKLEGASGR